MGIETWKVFPKILTEYPKHGVPLPCSDQNPRLKCPETRWARDFCLAQGGSCEYKIEAHFDCLEQYYPQEKVLELRKAFKPNTLDYPTSDTYIRYRHFYVGAGWAGGKRGWDGVV
ncbi:Cytochrome c oxidase copper chaperone [Trypanosoma melophagium]|uniref:Cytochrome c oxidase copper chaperone n=1 Tax=Trypanosoma melophagium TaxID=715481 RepID=UPI00351A11B5|nr:Cytochrome c oxidase copper chaperone [Trypanosoma melophagium]